MATRAGATSPRAQSNSVENDTFVFRSAPQGGGDETVPHVDLSESQPVALEHETVHVGDLVLTHEGTHEGTDLSPELYDWDYSLDVPDRQLYDWE